MMFKLVLFLVLSSSFLRVISFEKMSFDVDRILVMGVCGSGKSTFGKLLASKLGWNFVEADDFHSKGNVSKMASGIPLDDDDRWPWLDSVRKNASQQTVVACSALKKKYRRFLMESGRWALIYLRGDESVLRKRIEERKDHFAKGNLLKSQLEILEPPGPDEPCLMVNVMDNMDENLSKMLFYIGKKRKTLNLL